MLCAPEYTNPFAVERNVMPITTKELYAALRNMCGNDAEKLKTKLARDLEQRGYRLGMVVAARGKMRLDDHPYPTIRITLIDKSSWPYREISLLYNAVGKILEENGAEHSRHDDDPYSWDDKPGDPRLQFGDHLDDM